MCYSRFCLYVNRQILFYACHGRHNDRIHEIQFVIAKPFDVRKHRVLKTLTSGLGLDDMSLAWPAVVQLLVFIYSGKQ